MVKIKAGKRKPKTLKKRIRVSGTKRKNMSGAEYARHKKKKPNAADLAKRKARSDMRCRRQKTANRMVGAENGQKTRLRRQKLLGDEYDAIGELSAAELRTRLSHLEIYPSTKVKQTQLRAKIRAALCVADTLQSADLDINLQKLGLSTDGTELARRKRLTIELVEISRQ